MYPADGGNRLLRNVGMHLQMTHCYTSDDFIYLKQIHCENKTVRFTETSRQTHHITQCKTSEDNNLNLECCIMN